MQGRHLPPHLLFSLALLLAMPVSALAGNVTVDGKTWRQLTETVNTSWNTLAAACDSGTGVCGGAYSGWTWASQADVESLFSHYVGPAYTGGIYYEFVSAWAPAFFQDFDSTLIDAEFGIKATGFLRDIGPFYPTFAPVFSLTDIPSSLPWAYSDAIVLTGAAAGVGHSSIGAWMYLSTASVPEPGVLALMGLGMGMLGWTRRRQVAWGMPQPMLSA